MNYAPQIISYLGSREDVTEIYLVPRAFIMERRGGKLVKLSDDLLSPEDIRDTLVALRSHSPLTLGPLGREGMFSFGIQNVGRFRVSYMTQRGSYVVHIIKTPFHIPSIQHICQDKGKVEKLEEIMRLYNSGIIVFQCKNQVMSSTFIYSFLQNYCELNSKVIYILESPLNFLLKHGQSLVIQREIGTDVESFEEGLKDAFYINPDIIFISQREVSASREMEYLKRLLEEGTFILLNAPFVEDAFLKEVEKYLRALVSLQKDEKGLFIIDFKHIEPQA